MRVTRATLRRAAVPVFVALGLFAVVTLLALEANEVVLLRTADAAGHERDTRTWVADDGGFAWVEAANPDRPFLGQLRVRPMIDVVRAGVVHRCRAEPVPNPDGHALVRRLLAAKYGWADRWIGMLTDTSGSIAVRLACD